MSKPSELPIWATDSGAAVVDPGTAKKQQGWTAEIPPHEFFNFWQNLVYQWVLYLDTQVDAVAGQQNNYDAIVGTNGTDANIPDAIARVGSGAKILVTDDQVLQNTIVIDGLNDILLEFKPGVRVTTIDNLALAFSLLNCNRVQILGGRFQGFNNPGDIVFDVESTAKNTAFFRSYFLQNDTEIVDDGSNTEINVINEVL